MAGLSALAATAFSSLAGPAAADAAAVGAADAGTASALATIGAQNVAEGTLLATAAPELEAAATGAGLTAADVAAGSSSTSGVASALGTIGAQNAAEGSLFTAAAPGLNAAATGVVGSTALPTAGAGASGVGGVAIAPSSVPLGGAASGDFASTLGSLGDLPPGADQFTALASSAPGAPPGLTSGLDTATIPSAATPVVGAPTSLAAPDSANSLLTTAGNAISGIPGQLAKNLPATAGALISGGSLLYNLLGGDRKPANYAALEAQAQQDAAQGAQLQSYLTTGTLPPGLQAGLEQAHQAAAATIRGQYAQRGQTGSTAEAQDLQNLATTTMAKGAEIATSLLQQGVSESEFSSQLYSQLMQTSINQDQQLSQSIANFAGSLGRFGSSGTNQTYTLQPTNPVI